MKTCKSEGCHFPVFSKGLCRSHWGKQHGKPISQTSVKREGQLKQYSTRKSTFIDKATNKGKGKLFCGFCRQRIYADPDIHHTMGRDDETLLYEEYWHVAHRKCHTEYHSLSIKKISWWALYMHWLLKNMPDEVYQKELKKTEKS